MSKVLVIGNQAQFCFLNSTCAELALGLREIGHHAEYVSLPHPEADMPGFEAGYDRVCNRIQGMLDASEDFFVVDINCKLKFSSVKRRFGRDANLRRFCYVSDAPWSLFEHITSIDDDATISYVDRNHSEFYSRFPLVRPTVFLPHGGPVPDTNWSDSRPIDVLFIGNLALPCRMEHFEVVISLLPEPLKRVCRLTLDMIVWDGSDPFRAFIAALLTESLGVEALGPSTFMETLRFLATFAESYQRHRLLISLKHVKVTVAGSISPGFFEHTPSNLTLLGAVDEQEALALMRQSRILLNSVTVFPSGSHERVWYGMAYGAAICTERSIFIEETLSFGSQILSMEEAIDTSGEMLAEILANSSGVLETAHEARSSYAAHHTWRNRARIIHAAMS